nr:MFS transporter [Mycobacterium simiae]
MLVGYFMIVLDSTVVVLANPSLMAEQNASYQMVIWVTSAYLLAYAVPLLLAGRLGDRLGPKKVYLAGLGVFTAASLLCGFSSTIATLILARVVQGIGASLLFPQTLTMITRIFEPQCRGVALGAWTATGGVATLVGPLAGGVLVEAFGWEWIFFVNVPIGIVGLVLAARLLPVLPLHKQQLDLPGVGLSGLGLLLIVFGLQEGQQAGWAPWTWAILIGGASTLAGFAYWQAVNPRDPLIPLEIFGNRNFSLSNIGVAAAAFATTAMMVPAMFFAQAADGLSPTRSAVLIAPMVIVSAVVAPIAGKVADRYSPRLVIGSGFLMLALSLAWLSAEMSLTTPIWRLVLPITGLGMAIPFVWAPLATVGTRNLPSQLAGASAGAYTAARQLGAVLGSSGMAGFMTSRIVARLPPFAEGAQPPVPQGSEGAVPQLPESLREPFAAAMAQSLLLPALVALGGGSAALFMVSFTQSADTRHRQANPAG